MMSKENEQIQVEEKLIEVKKELAALRVAIKKQKEQAALQDEEQHIVLNVHEMTELYIEKKDANKKNVLAFEGDKLDTSPGSHTVVEL